MAEIEQERLTKIAVISMAIISIFIAGSLFYVTIPEPYSAVFIVPDSYANYLRNSSSISFVWGIQSFEQGPMNYSINIIFGNSSLAKKEIIFSPGQHQMDETFVLPANPSLPERVRLNVSVSNRSYEAHYWIKGIE